MARRRGHIHEDGPGVWRIVASYKDAGGQWRRKWQTVRGSRRDAEEVGRMLRPDYVSVWFPRLCERAGIRRLRFHDLRHTHSTLLAQAGHSMQLVAARMGHSTIATTANIYSHLAASEDRAAADVLDRIVEEGTL